MQLLLFLLLPLTTHNHHLAFKQILGAASLAIGEAPLLHLYMLVAVDALSGLAAASVPKHGALCELAPKVVGLLLVFLWDYALS